MRRPYSDVRTGYQQICLVGNPDEPTLVFGIPMMANIGVKEKRPLENFQLEPDITLPYDALINGKDTQIEAVGREMLRVIGGGGK